MSKLRRFTKKKEKRNLKRTKRRRIQRGGDTPTYTPRELTDAFLEILENKINYNLAIPNLKKQIPKNWIIFSKNAKRSLLEGFKKKDPEESKNIYGETKKTEIAGLNPTTTDEAKNRASVQGYLSLKKSTNSIEYCPVKGDIPPYCAINIYLKMAEEGRVQDMIDEFTKSYINYKDKFYKEKIYKEEILRRAFAWGRILYFQKNVTKPVTDAIQSGKEKAVSLFSSLKSIPDLVKTVFQIIVKFVNPLVDTSIKNYLNTEYIDRQLCLKLLFPYRLWFDPLLRVVMLVFANKIKRDPMCLMAVKDYFDIEIEDIEDRDTEDITTRFKRFKSTRHSFGDSREIDYSEILNYIFDDAKMCDFKTQLLVAKTLNKIIVISALIKRDKEIKFFNNPYQALIIVSRFLRDEIIEK
jgi:hypothetical protein